MRIQLIDNNDSFTYNLSQSLAILGADVEVLPVETLDLAHLAEADALVISPGPKSPKDYPIYTKLLDLYHAQKPILGVCLGHQILGEYFGSTVLRASHLMHGKTSLIRHTQAGLFEGIANPTKVARYHSLIVDRVPASCELLAETETGELMAMKHKTLPIYGIQFHPESFLTEQGEKILHNFLNVARAS